MATLTLIVGLILTLGSVFLTGVLWHLDTSLALGAFSVKAEGVVRDCILA
jgi:hypothetical protein